MKRYGDEEIVREEAEFERKEDFYEYMRDLEYTALNGRKVKSEAEREILNFFLTNKLNDKKIEIIYESPAKWMKYKNEKGEEITPRPDFYFPYYEIYLEHWAIGKNGKVPEWFSGENPTEDYIKGMNIKKEKFKENRKTLIETSYADCEKENLLEVLEKRFLGILRNKYQDIYFELQPLSYDELVKQVWDCATFVRKVHFNISRFINIAKTYRLFPEDIDKRLSSKMWSPKQVYFGKIANHIYRIYQEELGKRNEIDYSDMINLAVDYLKEYKEFYKNKYEHILIDEYQDVSTQRYDMVKELMNKNTNCKLFCVGDDWQSIMGFTGSNLNLFIDFSKYFPHPKRIDLTKNYRSIKSIVDTGVCIIKNNKEGQIKKKTISYSEEQNPVIVFSSKYRKKDEYLEQIAEHFLNKIREYCTNKGYNYSDFMVLMRITKNEKLRNFIKKYAESLNVPISEKPEKPNCVHIMSVHGSKGLQAKVVIILDVVKGLYGFPCELEDSNIFQPAMKGNIYGRKYKQEERRLFYVAVTRAKEEVMIYTQGCSESEFIREIKDFVRKKELGLRNLMIVESVRVEKQGELPDYHKRMEEIKENK